MQNKKYPVSFVIPVYKSENTISKVIDEINEEYQLDWEAILINDNSPDHVDLVIKKIIKKYPKQIIYLELHKNSGQHTAILSGFKYVTKPYVVTIDDDGQNPPSEVPKLLKYMTENNLDVVYGELKNRKRNLIRNLLSWANTFISNYTIGNKKGFCYQMSG